MNCVKKQKKASKSSKDFTPTALSGELVSSAGASIPPPPPPPPPDSPDQPFFHELPTGPTTPEQNQPPAAYRRTAAFRCHRHRCQPNQQRKWRLQSPSE
ncbi:hypothetical protein M0R45_004656 [Rubus argutus]|uniref:Uncharacterized protein n=1 Tax=Rubus argutus TaxID=59490 RepID=A0AAW1YKE3_RUBAR